ncbi:hypothetical protein ACU686_19940 [Yinghuangia aomiensis]
MLDQRMRRRWLWTAEAVFRAPVAAAWAAGAAWVYAETDAGVAALLLLLAVAGILFWGFGHQPGMIVALVTFLLTGVGAMAAFHAVTEHAFRGRAVTTSCLVRDVDRRVETSSSTDSQGHTTTTTNVYFDYDLACEAGRPSSMTIQHHAADTGERLDVAYDPKGRLDPRPAADVTDGEAALWLAVSCVGATAVLCGTDVFVNRLG